MSSSFFKAVEQNNFETQVIQHEYRLYHDDDNIPLYMTTEKPAGKYVTLTKQQYDTFRLDRIEIKNGKVKEKEIEQPKYVHPFARQPVEWIK